MKQEPRFNLHSDSVGTLGGGGGDHFGASRWQCLCSVPTAQEAPVEEKGTTTLFSPFAHQGVMSIHGTIQEATINHLTFFKITIKRKK